MKLAKKVLAIVMALGLIACMAAMAFATDGSYYLGSVTSNDGKVLKVTLYASNAIGLSSGKITVNYKGVAFDYADEGAQAALADTAKGNSFTFDVNDTTAGKVIFGFYFKENLWDAGTFKAAGQGAPLDINVGAFDLATFTFNVVDADYSVSVVYEGKDIYGGADYFEDAVVKANTTPEVTTIKEVSEIPTGSNAAPAPAPAGEPAPCDANSAPAAPACNNVKTDGGKNTGDNGVIAVMAGVIALAGAAFVVTKKRK